jgi:hypothetical protein
MGIGVAMFLIAAGAILTFALHTAVSGIALGTVGVILMIVGGVGLLVSLIFFAPRQRIRHEHESIDPVSSERIERRDVYRPGRY